MKRFVILILAALLFGTAVSAQQAKITITGSVVDENGDPMIGASVVCKSLAKGTMTDLDGRFVLELPSDAKDVEVSFIGYETQQVKLTTAPQYFKLVPEKSSELDEAVVIAYGKVTKKDITGSVGVVRMKDVETSPTASIDQALQGRIAGVDIMSGSGDPLSNSSIRIRGTRSITASNEPLIIVNGIMDAVQDIKDIDPSDIESISVLKDASSTAIYGSRGANGVILITTKSGKDNNLKINFNAKFGVSKMARKLDLMNKDQFIEYRNDYRYNEQWIAGATDITPSYNASDYPADTDWQDAITRVAPYASVNFSLSGSMQNKRWFYASVNYTDQEGIIRDSGFQRLNFMFNSTQKFNKWFKARLSISGSYRDENPNKAVIGGTSNSTGAVYLAPVIGPYDNHNPLIENSTLINTPVACIELNEYIKKKISNTDALTLTLTPVKGLTIESQNSVTLFQNHTYRFWPSTLPAKQSGEGADAYRYEADNIGLSSENTVNYKTKFGKSKLDLLAGFSAQQRRANTMDVKAVGMVTDYFKWNNLNAVTSKENYTVNSSTTQVVRESFFARANYDYASKYYLTATLRADGSSNFAENHKWGFFPSFALKWNAKAEPFFKNVRWMNNLDVRFSYGRTGNDSLSSYSALQAYATTTDSYLFDGVQGASFYPVRLASPDLTWEKTSMYNLGIDLAMFRDKVKLSTELYASRTTDLLLAVKTISSTGYSSRFENLGVTTNKGVEFTLETRNIETRNFGWTTTLSVSHNSQMVDNVGQEDYVPILSAPSGYMMYGYKSGYPLNALWGFEYGGVYKTSEEFDRNEVTRTYAGNAVYNRTTCLGRPRYVDQDKDGVISNNDLVYLGNGDPDVYGGLQNDFYFGNLSFSAYFSYSLGGKIYNYSEIYMTGGTTTNQYAYMTDAWHPIKNPESDLPRAGQSQTILPCTMIVHDASFLRLKTLNVSYRFDLKRKPIKAITLSVSGDNLWLLTKYNGFDPDVTSESEDSALRRVDLGAYPKARTIVGGVKIDF